VLSALFAHAASAAEHPTVRLEYTVASPEARCPSAEGLRALTAARLGYDPVTPEAGRLARVSVALRGGQVVGVLELLDEAGHTLGTRTLTAAAQSCESLAQSMALALAIAIDPQALLGAPRQPAAASAAPTEPLPPPQPTSAPWRWTTRLSVGAEVGAVPGTAVGLGVEAEARGERVGLAAWGQLSLMPSLAEYGGFVDASAVRAGLDGCAFASAFGLCLRAGGGALTVSGRGFPGSRQSTLPLATVGPRATAAWRPAPSLELRLYAGMDVALSRDSVFLGTLDAWQAPALSLDAGGSVGWTFW